MRKRRGSDALRKKFYPTHHTHSFHGHQVQSDRGKRKVLPLHSIVRAYYRRHILILARKPTRIKCARGQACLHILLPKFGLQNICGRIKTARMKNPRNWPVRGRSQIVLATLSENNVLQPPVRVKCRPSRVFVFFLPITVNF